MRSNLVLPIGFAEVENTKFKTKMDFVKYISDILANASDSDLYSPGLWSWLSAFYIDQVAPKDSLGNRSYGATHRHIPPRGSKYDDYRHSIRHLLRGPFFLYKRYGDLARIYLSNPLLDQLVLKTSSFCVLKVRS